MKALGPIPAGFDADGDGRLTVGGRDAETLVSEAGGTPLFVYDTRRVADQVSRFRTAFAGVALHFGADFLQLGAHGLEVGLRLRGIGVVGGGAGREQEGREARGTEAPIHGHILRAPWGTSAHERRRKHVVPL